jgi:hypothetical protein
VSKIAEKIGHKLYGAGVLDEEGLVSGDLFIAGVQSQIDAEMESVIRESIAPLIDAELAILGEHSTAFDALYEAAKFVKSFLDSLEDGEESDPLRKVRLRVHGPLHAKLDAALALADSLKGK